MGANDRKLVEQLVKRCEAVGWTVVKSGGDHWKVDTRRGVFTFATTPSRPRSYYNALQEARRYGLETLEAKLADRAEVDRQARIDRDRKLNDAKLAQLAAENGRPPTPREDLNLGDVDGVRIVEIAPLMIKTPIMRNPAPYAGGEELLLADGRVVYRCAKLGTWRVDENSVVDQTKPCHAVFDGDRSVMAHIAYHSQRVADITARRSGPGRGMKKLTATTKENEAMATPADPALKKIAAAYHGDPSAVASNDGDRELLMTRIEELAAAVFDVGAKLIDVRNGLITIADNVRKLEPQVVQLEPDPEVVEKARKFDALRGLIQ